MSEDQIIFVEEVEPEQKTSVVKIVAATLVAVLVHQNLKHRRIMQYERQKEERRARRVDGVMNSKFNPFR